MNHLFFKKNSLTYPLAENVHSYENASKQWKFIKRFNKNERRNIILLVKKR